MKPNVTTTTNDATALAVEYFSTALPGFGTFLSPPSVGRGVGDKVASVSLTKGEVVGEAVSVEGMFD